MKGPPAITGTTANWRDEAGFFLVALLLLGVGMWSPSGITGLDEYWHSMRTALETFGNSSWWLPQLDGEPRLRKPPLLYWEMATSFALFGPHFWSARLPSLLMGASFVWIMRRLSREVLGDDGKLTGWLTLTLIVVTVEARRAMLDLPLALCCAASVLLTWQAARTGSLPRLFAAAIVAALGWMTKGPVILIFTVAAAMAALWNPPQSSALQRRHYLAATALFALLCAIWPVSVLMQDESLLSVMSEEAGARQFQWFNPKFWLHVLGGLASTTLPWSFVLILAVLFKSGREQLRASPALRWLALWILLAAIPFLFVRTFERYLIPMLPPALLLISARLQYLKGASRPHLLTATALIALPCLLISLFALYFDTALFSPGLATLALGAALFSALLTQARATCMALALSLSLVLGVVYPSIGVNKLPDTVRHTLAEHPVWHFGQPQPGVLSMNLGRSVQLIEANTAAAQQLTGYEGYLILNQQDETGLLQLAALINARVDPVLDFGMFYARTTFLKFARPDATTADWQRALAQRSLESLKSRFVVVRLQPRTTPHANAAPVSAPTAPEAPVARLASPQPTTSPDRA